MARMVNGHAVVNGWRGSTLNGYATNGHPTNGVTVNGDFSNGHLTSGVTVKWDLNGANDYGQAVLNGSTLNETATNGHPTNTVTATGDSTNCHPPISMPVNGISSSGDISIAICGMAVRLPGGIDNTSATMEILSWQR